jgi:REP element-mobilizing transposase RayT
MARGVDGRNVFMDDQDRVAFLQALGRIAKESGATVLAYCLMGNHFHLAVQVGPIPLSSIMHRLLTGYSLAFNLNRGREGHLFQSRYRAIVCVNEAYLAALIRYIHQNPVRAGLVRKARHWPWSSLRFQPDAEADNCLVDFNPWLNAPNVVLDLKRSAETPSEGLEEIGKRICLEAGVAIGELRSAARHRCLAFARVKLTKEAIKSGHTLNSVARWLHTTASSVTRYSKYR